MSAPATAAPARPQNAGPRFKTKYCHMYMKTGTCTYGATCAFAHGKEELAQRTTTRGGGAHPVKKTLITPPTALVPEDDGGCSSLSPLAGEALYAFAHPFWSLPETPHCEDYGFGGSVADERRRAAEGNHRVTPEDLERYRMERRAEAIAKAHSGRAALCAFTASMSGLWIPPPSPCPEDYSFGDSHDLTCGASHHSAAPTATSTSTPPHSALCASVRVHAPSSPAPTAARTFVHNPYAWC